MGQQQREDDLNDLLSEILSFSETFFTAGLFVLASGFCLLIPVLECRNLQCLLFSLSFKENVPELLESDHRVPVYVRLHHHLLEVVIGEAYP